MSEDELGRRFIRQVVDAKAKKSDFVHTFPKLCVNRAARQRFIVTTEPSGSHLAGQSASRVGKVATLL